MAQTRSRSSSRSSSGSSSRATGSAKVTTDHDKIRRWVEQRGGNPACVKATKSSGSCLLRIDYPGYSGEERLEKLDWNEFFKRFDQNNLAFLYQDKTKTGRTSRFSKFIDQETSKQPRRRHGR